MTTLVEGLLLGSAKVDFMKDEISKLTKMLFELAGHPHMWIRASELQGKWNTFHAQFGGLDEDGCAWEIWWSEEEFRTRCLVYENSERPRGIVCAYGNAEYEPHKPRKIFEVQQREYKRLGVTGIALAHSHLEVFAKGMLHDFSLGVTVAPFLAAAEQKLI
jgi:hypothetical protein